MMAEKMRSRQPGLTSWVRVAGELPHAYGNPDSTRSAVSSPDPDRLERAATLTGLRAGRTLTG